MKEMMKLSNVFEKKEKLIGGVIKYHN